jgi:phosphopantothenoylcysteine decarboxylase/phosphopantothenate--cysteine ligase
MSNPAGAGENPLAGKTVLLGVCGGIAAYKAVEVCRRLSDAGARVLPVLTRGATRFVAPLTFSALAAEPARVSLFPGPLGASGAAAGDGTTGRAGTHSAEPVPHIALARRADLVVVAPATARLLGSYAAGISSDLLTATLLATRASVLVCPAMHTEMWEHPAVQDNVALLRRRGVEVLEPDEGRLAGGEVGKGRLPAPEAIVVAAAALMGRAQQAAAALTGRAQQAAPVRHAGALAGVRAVVSAGGTREPIDPVRYLGNRSSGQQGYVIAAELLARGAQVTLVSAAALERPPGADVVEVETAAEMAEAVLGAAAGARVVVMAAAVADYRPAITAEQKWKKSAAPVSVELVPTLDILAELGARRRPGQVLVGFAAETARELAELGRGKLEAKGADLVVANEVGRPGAGFGSQYSRAVIVSRERTVDLGLVDKRALASKLADAIEELLVASAGQTASEATPLRRAAEPSGHESRDMKAGT